MSDPLGGSEPTAARVKHSGPNTKFCVLCLSGEHERVDEADQPDETLDNQEPTP